MMSWILGAGLGLVGALASLTLTRYSARRVVAERHSNPLVLAGPALTILSVAVAIPFGETAVWGAAIALIVGRWVLVGAMAPEGG